MRGYIISKTIHARYVRRSANKEVQHSNKEKIILHLCASEFGSDSKPYRDAGYDVRRITKDIGVKNFHPPENVYGIIANPPCTKFSRAAWQIPKANRDFKEGMRLVKECLRVIWEVQENGAQLRFWVIENPDGYLAQFLGRPPFSYQPWQFGETDFRATKRTMLWGYFNPPTKTIRVRTIPFRSSHSRDTTRVNKGWSEHRNADERSNASPYFTKAFFEANP
jgi:site-specific DNA-cytosine methylase